MKVFGIEKLVSQRDVTLFTGIAIFLLGAWMVLEPVFQMYFQVSEFEENSMFAQVIVGLAISMIGTLFILSPSSERG
jgi:hypothetical protein